MADLLARKRAPLPEVMPAWSRSLQDQGVAVTPSPFTRYTGAMNETEGEPQATTLLIFSDFV
jgi:hypothetical protein